MDPKKPGMYSTEFWITILIQVLNVCIQAGVFPADHWSMKVAGMAAAALSAAVYAHSRSVVKSAPPEPPAIQVNTGGTNTQNPPDGGAGSVATLNPYTPIGSGSVTATTSAAGEAVKWTFPPTK